MCSQIIGQAGESAVINLLQKDGFAILEQNYKKFFGEIDIIAQKDTIIAFVEVKTRTRTTTSMFEIVTPAKQRKIIMTAQAYIAENNKMNMTYRFDVALVQIQNKIISNITHIPNAFCQKENI